MENFDPKDRPAPSHRCKICGAFWRLWLKSETNQKDDSWSLIGSSCGKCCDMAPMGEQIRFATVGDIAEYLGK